VRVEWTDEQELLREAVAGVVAREAPFAAVREWAQAGQLAAADALAVRQGWTGIGLAEDAGGQGGGTLELAVLAEELGRGAVPWDRTLAGCVCAPLLAATGAEEALALAAATAEGEQVAVLAVDARRPLEPAEDVRATRCVLGAPGAHTLIFPLRHGDEIELLADRADARSRTLVDRTRALGDVEPGAPRSLGTVELATLESAGAAAAVLVAADALGAASRLLDETVAYVRERRQFGVPVGSFQAVKHAAAEMLVDVEASRSAVMYAAWAISAGEPDAGLHASIAKSVACGAAVRVADKALFLHGAIGYTWEHDLQFPFKRAKSDALLYGSPDTHRDLIAEQLGLTREPQPVA
jgi:alkylation response protein AidB-like acyl-CoA dehydrogenase